MRRPRLPVGAVTALAVAAFAVRWGASARLPENPASRLVLFHRPWDRVPLLDLLSSPFGTRREYLAMALGALAVVAVAHLAADALPRRAAIGVGVVAVVLPSMVWAGAWWSHAGLVLLVCIVAARALAEVLDHDGEGFPLDAAMFLWVLLLTDWPAWAPVLAWAGRLWVFPPEHLPAPRVRRATLAVTAAVLAALPLYVGLLLMGANPETALSAREMPLGAEALFAVAEALAGTIAGRTKGLPIVVTLGLAVLMIGAALVGARRVKERRPGWADVMLVGSLGAFVPALAAQPWIPLAADKHVWYVGPLVLCLGAAAVVGPSSPRD